MAVEMSLFQDEYETLVEPCLFWNLLECGGDSPRLISAVAAGQDADGQRILAAAEAVRRFCSDNHGWLKELASRVAIATNPSESKRFLVEFVTAVRREIDAGRHITAWEELETQAKSSGLSVSLRDLVTLVGMEMQAAV